MQRAATERQVLTRFWIMQGMSPSHGFRVLRDLVAAGQLQRHPLYRGEGRRSQYVLTLPRRIRRGLTQNLPPAPRVPETMLLQWAQVVLVRQAEGWELIPPTAAWKHLKQQSFVAARRRFGRHDAGLDLSRLSHLPDPNLGLWGLVHRQSGELRLVVPVRSIMGLGRICSRIAKRLAYPVEFQPIGLELVVGAVSPEAAEAFATRWFRGTRWVASRGRKHKRPRHRMAVTVTQVPSYQLLTHAMKAPRPAASVYVAAGVPGPLEPQPTLLWLATRDGGVL